MPIPLHHETIGPPDGVPLLLVNGFTAQLVSLPDGLVDAFVEAGYFVVRFDNRDVGLSPKTPGPPPELRRLVSGEQSAPYLLAEMAADAGAVLDAVGLESAHVWGASMGGMIAQTLAIELPERCRSLTSVMSSTGDLSVGQGSAEAVDALRTPLPADREGYIEASVARAKVTNGPLFDEGYVRVRAGREYDRCYHPVGGAFQMAAIVASGDRTPALRRLSLPTTVIHGTADALITASGGEATAAAIPGAKLVLLDDMGHNYPERYWPRFVSELDELVART